MSRSDLHLRFHCLTAVLAAALATALMLGCAAVGPPGGGTEDREAPVIVSTAPGLGETGVDPGAELQITFSEGVSHASLAEALFISPPPSEKPRIRWRGRTAFVKLQENLPPDQTVTVTIGAGLKDERSNTLTDSYTFAFSTGEKIDNGRIEGLVFTETSAKGMLAGCWLVEGDTLDTLRLNPALRAAPFLTQVGADNRFILQHLPPGVYRVMVWGDKNNDRLYQPGLDALGLPWRDFPLTANEEQSLTFYPAPRDTGSLKLLLMSFPDRQHITLRFSRPLTLAPDRIAREFVLRDSVGSLSVIGAWQEARDSTRLTLWTSNLSSGATYRVFFKGEEIGIGAVSEAKPDTIGASISAFSPERGERDVSDQPTGWIAFSDALGDLDWKSVLSLNHSDSVAVPLYIYRAAPNRLAWKALEAVPSGKTCRLTLLSEVVPDVAGNLMKDSLWTNSFTIIDPSSTGEITGVVGGCIDRPIRVIARPVRGRTGKDFLTVVAGDGSYKLTLLPADDYLLWAFVDRNNNGTLDRGNLRPFEPAERLTVCPDTITVRARWETSKIDFNF